MVVQKLGDSDAFIVSDLDGAPSAGIVRAAPKILVDGATTLARSLTYLYASFGQQMGGASAGINAKPDDRPAAVAAFVAEVGPRVEDGSLQLVAGKGVADGDLDALRARQPRPGLTASSEGPLLAAGVIAATAAARGGLDGARVALDGLDRSSAVLVSALADAGATVVAASSSTGSVADAGGIDAAALAAALQQQDAAGVGDLGLEVGPASAVFAADADVLLVGSKVGAIDHDVAAGVTAGLVVPTGPVPVTAKALAALRRSGTVVLPDFLSAAGPWFATFPSAPPADEQVAAAVTQHVAAAVTEVIDHADGPLLGACYRAEAHLRTWRESLPFGRPLA